MLLDLGAIAGAARGERFEVSLDHGVAELAARLFLKLIDLRTAFRPSAAR